MNTQADAVLSITGDATLVYIAPVDLTDPLATCNLEGLGREERASIGRDVAELSPRWSQLATNQGHGALDGGQSVLVARNPLREQVVADFAMPVRPGLAEEFRRLLGHHRSALEDSPGGLQVEVDRVGARLFANGILSFAVTMRVPDAWSESREEFTSFFGPEMRTSDPVGRAVRDLLFGQEKLHTEDADPSLADTARSVLADRGTKCTSDDLDIGYFHVVYTGTTELDLPGCAVVGDEDREWVYAQGPQDIASMSPHRDEFAYVGYAFTLLVTRPTPPPRLPAVVDLIGVVQAQYEHLAATCDALENRLSHDTSLRLQDLNELEQQASSSYQRLATPTFTFDNHVLRLRSGLMSQWGLQELLERSRHLIATIRTREQQRRDRRMRILNRILLLIGLMAVIDTLNSIVSLADWLSG